VEKNVKILLIICVVLVVGLSLTIGMIMGNVMNKPITLNTTNNTTPTVNTTVNQSQSTQTTTKKTESEDITSSQAATIALRYGKASVPDGDWSVGSVDFVPAANYENTPNYMVELSNNGPVTSGIARAMDVRINATNGAIME
jgi:cytoskeletal protein RodZ